MSFFIICLLSTSVLAELTAYGTKEKGSSSFIIVAPHGPDDLYTIDISKMIAKNLHASLIINSRFDRDSSDSMLGEDFNSLPYYRGFYNWSSRKEAMHIFYEDICSYSGDGSVIVFVHGMADRGNLGVDIGYGAKITSSNDTYMITYAQPPNTGLPRASTEEIIVLDSILDSDLAKMNYRSGIGDAFPAWSMTNGVQYDCPGSESSLQLEISRSLREKTGMISKYLASALSKSFIR